MDLPSATTSKGPLGRFKMFEIEEEAAKDLEMIEFGQAGKVLFKLPRLGQKGLPIGLMTAFTIFYDRVQTTGFTESSTASAWTYFIDVLRSNFPDSVIPLSRLNEEQIKQVITHWVQVSPEFDPKA